MLQSRVTRRQFVSPLLVALALFSNTERGDKIRETRAKERNMSLPSLSIDTSNLPPCAGSLPLFCSLSAERSPSSEGSVSWSRGRVSANDSVIADIRLATQVRVFRSIGYGCRTLPGEFRVVNTREIRTTRVDFGFFVTQPYCSPWRSSSATDSSSS